MTWSLSLAEIVPTPAGHPLEIADFETGPLALSAPALARRLIGTTLLLDGVGGVVVETEAYTRDDPASHSFRGPTPRNRSMFGPAGRAYVYRSYGLHWCFNIVAAEQGAVLLRALAPLSGLAEMAARRGAGTALCSGPGRLAQALGISLAHDGLAVTAAPFVLLDRGAEPPLLTGPRIGISKAQEQPWRYGLAGSTHLSRAFPRR